MLHAPQTPGCRPLRLERPRPPGRRAATRKDQSIQPEAWAPSAPNEGLYCPKTQKGRRLWLPKREPLSSAWSSSPQPLTRLCAAIGTSMITYSVLYIILGHMVTRFQKEREKNACKNPRPQDARRSPPTTRHTRLAKKERPSGLVELIRCRFDQAAEAPP